MKSISFLFLIFSLSQGPAGAEVTSTIAAIEQLHRARRLIAYPEAIRQPRIALADRLALTIAFSKHVKKVSPHYLRTRRAWDLDAWISILERGFQAAPQDPDIAWSLAQIHINERRYSKALPIAEAFKQANPNHHHAVAWQIACNSLCDGTPLRSNPKNIRVMPVHFCVLTKNPTASQLATMDQCRQECEILNHNFRSSDGHALVEFSFKSFSSYAQIRNTQSDLIQYGDSVEPYDSNRVARAFNQCKDTQVRDPNAINFYIFDSHSDGPKFSDRTSHGKRNSNRPYLMLDWQRLGNNDQNAEAHEMGHCFGLGHVGVPGASKNSPTNIMTSAGEQFGSGGARTHGFTEAQIALILYHAKRTSRRLGITTQSN
ncbi:MAG: hypothetical protein P8L85_20185 [Rubripirellula sp.]|nr:hypothetical protein [Rubripirellula sp.]